MRFAEEWENGLENTPNCGFYIQKWFLDFWWENGRAVGVKTSLGMTLDLGLWCFTNGTFLKRI